LTRYLFDLNQSNVCIDIQKIDGLIRQYPFLKNYQMTKRLNRPEEEVEEYFPGFMALRLYRARNTKTKGQDEKKDILLWQEEKTYNKESIHN
jgi:hypothetical protein